MPLNVDTRDCDNVTLDAMDQDMVNAQYNVLMMLPGIIGMELTQDTFDAYVSRVNFYEKLFGANIYSYDGDERNPLYLTADNLRPWIGLRTNWGKRMTKAQFLKHMGELMKVA